MLQRQEKPDDIIWVESSGTQEGRGKLRATQCEGITK